MWLHLDVPKKGSGELCRWKRWSPVSEVIMEASKKTKRCGEVKLRRRKHQRQVSSVERVFLRRTGLMLIRVVRIFCAKPKSKIVTLNVSHASASESFEVHEVLYYKNRIISSLAYSNFWTIHMIA